MGEVLLAVLVDRGGERGVALGVEVGDADGLLGSRRQGFGELNSVVLGITVKKQVSAGKWRLMGAQGLVDGGSSIRFVIVVDRYHIKGA